jgi:hypothetical protein
MKKTNVLYTKTVTTLAVATVTGAAAIVGASIHSYTNTRVANINAESARKIAEMHIKESAYQKELQRQDEIVLATIKNNTCEKIDPSVSITVDKYNSGIKLFSVDEVDKLSSMDNLAEYSLKLFEDVFGISVGVGNVLPIILFLFFCGFFFTLYFWLLTTYFDKLPFLKNYKILNTFFKIIYKIGLFALFYITLLVFWGFYHDFIEMPLILNKIDFINNLDKSLQFYLSSLEDTNKTLSSLLIEMDTCKKDIVDLNTDYQEIKRQLDLLSK